jgi:hypothetical protein
MSVLAFATGISQIAQKESTQGGTTSSGSIAPYVKEGISVNITDSSVNKTLYFDALPDTFWASATFYITSLATFAAGYPVMEIGDGTTHLLRVLATSSETLTLYWHNGTDYEYCGDIDAGSFSGSVMRLDLEFNYGTSGSIVAYVDREEDFTYSVDTTTHSVTCTQLELGSPTSANSRTMYASSIFLADEDSTLLTMYQHEITGDGTVYSGAFTGDYTLINALGSTGDTTSIQSESSGDSASFTVEDADGTFTGGTVVGVGVCARIKNVQNSDISGFSFLATDGTDEITSDVVTIDQYITPYTHVFETAPDGSAWTIANISDYEFGITVTDGE